MKIVIKGSRSHLREECKKMILEAVELRKKKKFNEAIPMFLEARKIANTSNIILGAQHHLKLAQCYIAAGMYYEAIQDAMRIITGEQPYDDGGIGVDRKKAAHAIYLNSRRALGDAMYAIHKASLKKKDIIKACAYLFGVLITARQTKYFSCFANNQPMPPPAKDEIDSAMKSIGKFMPPSSIQNIANFFIATMTIKNFIGLDPVKIIEIIERDWKLTEATPKNEPQPPPPTETIINCPSCQKQINVSGVKGYCSCPHCGQKLFLE